MNKDNLINLILDKKINKDNLHQVLNSIRKNNISDIEFSILSISLIKENIIDKIISLFLDDKILNNSFNFNRNIDLLNNAILKGVIKI